MRRTCHTKEDWVGIKWRGGVIQHPVQEDNFSCGVLVMEMAKEVLESFPEIPTMKFGTSKAEMANQRREMAEQILEASVLDEANTCAMCATVRPPGPGPPLTDWIECGKCQRWYHVQCLGLTTQQFNQVKERKWNCCLCC